MSAEKGRRKGDGAEKRISTFFAIATMGVSPVLTGETLVLLPLKRPVSRAWARRHALL
jgi:hypothetical protein